MPPDSFPVLSESDGWRAATLLRREVCMLRVIESLTNKPEWWRKVHDSAIAEKWKKEMLEMDWPSLMEFGDFTSEMADAVVAELRKKADIYEKTGLVPVLDYSACVVKSDKIIGEDQTLVDDLKKAVASLEDVPEDQKDWHPGSDEKVLDLVHPSLYPLVYGRSRVLNDRRINLENALEHCGTGEVIPSQKETFVERGSFLSKRFQWLPCDVNIAGGKAEIDSYINNLHPTDHADLYPVIERFIEKSLPAWDLIYRWPKERQYQRIVCTSVCPRCKILGDQLDPRNYCDCTVTERPVDEDEDERANTDDDDERWEGWYKGSEREKRDLAWYIANHPLDMSKPDVEAANYPIKAPDIKTEGFFGDAARVQVIVKLANIHLTPESPSYDGGSWHIEGQLNEHIVATALFYYDSENISDCNLDFRATADKEDLGLDLEYAQSDELNIQRAFAIDDLEDINQDVGSVLTRPNRALFFPNLFQHHVSPFQLVDSTKSGHRKILALFLVDPAIPIISTANVPPQQRSWWSRQVNDLNNTALMNLPPEIRILVSSEVQWPIDEEEAKETRLELMAERSKLSQEKVQSLVQGFAFCEH